MIAISIAYFVVLFVIAFINRKNESLEEYIVAGKKLGSLVTATSSRATGTSAWLILGYTGFGYAFGIKGLWIAFGEAICVYVSWCYIVPRFKKLADRLGANTYTEFLEKATHDKTGLVRLVSSIVICLLVVSYVSAQFLGMGKAFEVFFDMPLSYGIWLGMILTVSYTVVGGYRAISWTDFVQALIMLFGIILLLVMLVMKIPAINYQAPIHFPNGFWSLLGSDGFSFRGVAMAISFFAIGVGLFGIPHMFVPFIAARNVDVIKRGAPSALIFTLATEFSALAMGILARYLIMDLADAEQIMPLLSKTLLSPVWTGVLVTVIFASIMSTADGLMMAASTSLIYDLYRNYLKADTNRDRHLIMLSRICLVVVSCLGAFLAQQEYNLIFWLVVFVWSALASAFVPVCMSLSYGKVVSNYQAVTSIITGFLVAVLWKMFFSEVTGLGEIVVGILAAYAAIPISGKLAELYPRLANRDQKTEEYEEAT